MTFRKKIKKKKNGNSARNRFVRALGRLCGIEFEKDSEPYGAESTHPVEAEATHVTDTPISNLDAEGMLQSQGSQTSTVSPHNVRACSSLLDVHKGDDKQTRQLNDSFLSSTERKVSFSLGSSRRSRRRVSTPTTRNEFPEKPSAIQELLNKDTLSTASDDNHGNHFEIRPTTVNIGDINNGTIDVDAEYVDNSTSIHCKRIYNLAMLKRRNQMQQSTDSLLSWSSTSITECYSSDNENRLPSPIARPSLNFAKTNTDSDRFDTGYGRSFSFVELSKISTPDLHHVPYDAVAENRCKTVIIKRHQQRDDTTTSRKSDSASSWLSGTGLSRSFSTPDVRDAPNADDRCKTVIIKRHRRDHDDSKSNSVSNEFSGTTFVDGRKSPDVLSWNSWDDSTSSTAFLRYKSDKIYNGTPDVMSNISSLPVDSLEDLLNEIDEDFNNAKPAAPVAKNGKAEKKYSEQELLDLELEILAEYG